MKTKNEIIIQLKKAHPFLRLGSEEQGYSQLNSEEYEAQINEWAEAELAKQETDIEASIFIVNSLYNIRIRYCDIILSSLDSETKIHHV